MKTIQNLTVTERDAFLNMVFNLTSTLNDDELTALRTYITYGPDFDSIDYDVRTIMLSTNRLVPQGGYSQMTNIPKVDDVINKIDKALLDYEVTIGMYSIRNLEKTIRFSLKSRQSERCHWPQMSQIKAEISLHTNMKLIFHKNVGW